MSSEKAQNGVSERTSIIHALERARKALNRYEHLRQKDALQNKDPEEDPEVIKTRVTLQTAVMDAFVRLRPYLRTKRPEYWKNANLDDDEGVQKFDGDGLQSLDGQTDVIEIVTTEQWERHQGPEPVKEVKTNLMPVPRLRRILNLLSEASVELGFGAEVEKELEVWGFEEVTPDGDLADE